MSDDITWVWRWQGPGFESYLGELGSAVMCALAMEEAKRIQSEAETLAKATAPPPLEMDVLAAVAAVEHAVKV